MGVDVGGSGLRLVVDGGSGPGAVATAPGARVGAGGIDVEALAADARRLLRGSGVAGADRPDAVGWSMRGLLHLADPAEVVGTVAAALGARCTAVVSDAVASLVGALGAVVPGAVVAAGTGAVAFGTDFEDHWTRVDGWGHVLGDRGSAAWVGMAGLRVALRALDGVSGGSAAVLAAAEGLLGPAEGWPRRVMTGPDAPEVLASVAPLVTAAAASGDPVAAAICREAGEALGESLLEAARGLSAPRLAATGGLLRSEPVRAALDAVVGGAGRAVSPALGGALDGALVLAGELADGRLHAHPTYVHLG